MERLPRLEGARRKADENDASSRFQDEPSKIQRGMIEATMHFHNATPFPAFLHREAVSGDRIAAAAIVRATFEIGTPCAASVDQVWKVCPTPWDGPCGPMESDAFFDRDGCDLLLIGDAASPDSKPVSALDVSVSVGTFSTGVRVFGNRAWQRRGEELVPSDPEPFVRMPLGLERAYGGVATFDELQVPSPDNARGKGFYLEKDEAAGAPLPNIEDPRALIRTWQDRPEPVGVGICPFYFAPRARRAAEIKDDRVVRIRRSIYNVAFPRLVCPHVSHGALVRIKGMGPDLAFRLPEVTIVARARVGDTEHLDPLRIDQIGIEPERARFFVTYRYTFIYPLRRGELRRCEISLQGSGAARTAASPAVGS